ncbi:tRNA (5-methylaminomethyl-2-thiouridine)(34)-methyltransferase MnmD [Persephonella sp.]
MDSKIITADGTETFVNKEYGEAYHSTKAGAYTESIHKFINPCNIQTLSKKKEVINILDIGFGLGYNVAAAITEAKKVNPEVKLNIISIEKDRNIFNKIKQLTIPESLKESYQIILSGQFQEIYIKKQQFEGYVTDIKNVTLKVLLGEGRRTLKNLLKTGLKFDAVFYDPFSPKVNTEMWTVEIFKVVKDLMTDKAVLATYSASLAVRKGLLEAGFKIGLVEPVGRKSYSTVATISGEIPPLTEKEEKRIKTSPYAVPYRDNEDLSLSSEEIKKEWEKRVSKNIGS